MELGESMTCCMELILAIDNILGSNVDQLDFLEAQKVKRHLNILQHVEAHLAFLPRLKMEHQLDRQVTKAINA
jgi:hypothetical protein